MSTPRTWKERGEWMERYDIRVSKDGRMDSVSPAEPSLRWLHTQHTRDVEGEVDMAIAVCQRLEQEAAEQAKRQQEAASRSPIAALNEEWEASNRQSQTAWYSHLKLDAAIKAQAARWRRAAQATRDVGGYGQFAEVLEKCANDLEGK